MENLAVSNEFEKIGFREKKQYRTSIVSPLCIEYCEGKILIKYFIYILYVLFKTYKLDKNFTN